MTNNMVRLGIMMFLQFYVWGAWYVSMTGFINKEKMTDLTGAAYTVGPLAAILAPFFLGMIADRFFASERVLAVLHLIGAACLIAAPFAAANFTLDPPPEDASLFHLVVFADLKAYIQPFTLLLLAHMLCYMPTLGLTTSLAFSHLQSQEKQFPIIRVLGTIGWIAGNLSVSLLPGKDASAAQFYLAGGAGLLLAAFSFLLPHTPPPAKGKQIRIGQILGLDSLRLLKQPPYLIFIICSFLLCIPLAGYYAQARNFVAFKGVEVFESATFTMSFGQMSEVFFMLVMPLLFIRLGVKNMLAIGMLAWVVRYGLFGAAAEMSDTAPLAIGMVLMGVLLHGICYDFFFVTGMIYVDKKAPKEVRSQAQGFLVLITQGLGLGLGAKLFFAHVKMNTEGTGDSAVVDWQTVWLYPAIMAGVVLVIFFIAFWDRLDNGQKSPPGK